MADESSPLAVFRKASKALYALADEIDNHQKNLDVAKLSFSVTGAAGGIMTVAGLLLTPVIFGTPFGLVIAGGVVGVISATGNIGSGVADTVLTSKTITNAQKELNALVEKVNSVKTRLSEKISKLNEEERDDLLQRLPKINPQKEVFDVILKSSKVVATIIKLAKDPKLHSNELNLIIELAESLTKWSRAQEALHVMKNGAIPNKAANAVNAAKAVESTADVGSDALRTAGKTFSRAKNVGIAVAGLGLAFDLGAIVYYSMKVHKMEPCKVAENIREVARRLE